MSDSLKVTVTPSTVTEEEQKKEPEKEKKPETEKKTDPTATSSTGTKANEQKIVDLGLQNNEYGFYDEVEIEDMEYDKTKNAYFYPCPCGDRFVITRSQLLEGEEIAECPSCSLRIHVIYDLDSLAAQDPPNQNS